MSGTYPAFAERIIDVTLRVLHLGGGTASGDTLVQFEARLGQFFLPYVTLIAN